MQYNTKNKKHVFLNFNVYYFMYLIVFNLLIIFLFYKYFLVKTDVSNRCQSDREYLVKNILEIVLKYIMSYI